MNQENISLNSLFRQTIEFYKKMIISFFKSLKKHWIYALVLLFIFGAFFAFKYTQTKTYSTVKIGYVFNCFNKKYYGDILHDLDRIVASRDYKKLAKLLNIEEHSAANILSLEARNIVNSKLHEDFTDEKIPFYVHLKILENTDATEIQEAITLYLQRDDYSNKQILARNQSCLDYAMKLDKELLVINELIKPEAKDLIALLQLRNEKLTEKIRLARESKVDKNINLLKQFESFRVSKSTQIKSLAIKLSLLFVFLVFVITTFMLWYKNEK